MSIWTFAPAIYTNAHYTMKKAWTGFAQYTLQATKPPKLISFHPSSIATTLGVTCHPLPAKVVINIEGVAPEMLKTDLLVGNYLPASSHPPYMAIAVHVRKHGNLSTIVRSSKNHRMNTATDTATAAVKKEDVLAIIEAAKSSNLSLEWWPLSKPSCKQ